MPRKPDPRAKGVRTVKPHIRPNGRKLRSKENADLICEMIEEGKNLEQVAEEMGCKASAITNWVREDGSNGGAEISARYARAMEFRFEMMAEDLLKLADDKGFMAYPEMASALVNQQRLAVDSRKWLLSKMHPRRFGDRVEISGDPSAPIVSRIELVAVAPRQIEPPTIEGKTDENDG